jgi:hypothetical protein
MKRALVVFAFILLYILPAKSQTFKVGLLGGVNITDVDGMDPVDNDNDFKKFGFAFGGFVGVHLAPKTMLQMEISYSQKGSQFPPYVDTTTIATSNTNPNPNQNLINGFEYKLRLNYINVDVAIRHNIQINFGKSPVDRFSIEGGASVGYLFHYFYEVNEINYILPLKTTDISAFVGFSYNFSENFCIDLRYYNSILSIFQSDGASNSQWLYYGSWNRGHNLDFQITFKYTFGGGTTSNSNNTAPAATPQPQ